MISVRRVSEDASQQGEAALAAANAVARSSAEAKSTRRVTSPVAGSYTSPWRPDVPETWAPPIQCWTWPIAAPVSAVDEAGSASWVMTSEPRVGGGAVGRRVGWGGRGGPRAVADTILR